MAKSGMKKAKIHARSERAIQQEQELLQEQQAKENALMKKKQRRKTVMKETMRTMLGIYSLLFTVLAWMIDWMGLVALGALILSIVGIYKLKNQKDKYYWFCVAAAVLSAVRLIWELVNIIQYFLR
jgi:Flp pilus assembly protein TadB